MNNIIKKLCIIICVFTAAHPLALTGIKAADVSATVSAFKGDVSIKKSGGAKTFKPYNGMALSGGDTVTTGKKSSITIKNGSKTTSLGAETQVTVDSLRDSGNAKSAAVTVVKGTVSNKVKEALNVNSKDHVRTSTVVAGVRGTEYILNYERGKPVRIFMIEGTLNLSQMPVAFGNNTTGDTMFMSTDRDFIDTYGSRYTVNSTHSKLDINDIDRELLLILAADPELKANYPVLHEQINDVLSGKHVVTAEDIISQIEEKTNKPGKQDEYKTDNIDYLGGSGGGNSGDGETPVEALYSVNLSPLNPEQTITIDLGDFYTLEDFNFSRVTGLCYILGTLMYITYSADDFTENTTWMETITGNRDGGYDGKDITISISVMSESTRK